MIPPTTLRSFEGQAERRNMETTLVGAEPFDDLDGDVGRVGRIGLGDDVDRLLAVQLEFLCFSPRPAIHAVLRAQFSQRCEVALDRVSDAHRPGIPKALCEVRIEDAQLTFHQGRVAAKSLPWRSDCVQSRN